MLTPTRSIAAMTALTVTAALSLCISSARSFDATGSGTLSRVEPAAVLRVDVVVRKHRIIRSENGFRPGNTVFDLTSVNGGGAAIQLMRLRRGYTFTQFQGDIESDSIQAIRRIDRLAIFYGGMPVSPGQPSHFGARLDAGRYLLFDFDRPLSVRLRVKGAPERRSLPKTTGSVNMVLHGEDHRFQTPRHLPRSGWLRQTNRTDEPHFMDMFKVKRSTTRKQVRRLFAGQGPEDPKWLLAEYPGTFVISRGRTVVWRYAYPRGKYLELCFWPSKDDGMTHAEMGMFNFVTLH